MKQLTFLFLLLFCVKAKAMDAYCNGAPTTIQTNGGGNVALTATVDPTVYVGPNASVCEYATVLGNAQINDQTRVYGYARVGDGSIISNNAEIYGNASLETDSSTQILRVLGNAKIFGNARLTGNVIINGSASIYENGRVSDTAYVIDSAQVYGNASINGNALIQGSSKIHGIAYIGKDTTVSGVSDLCSNKKYPSGMIFNITDCTSSPPLESTSYISVGGAQTCALLGNRRLRCWGNNLYGQLGIGTTSNVGDNELPKNSPYVALNVDQVANGFYHTCFLSNGNVSCWGYNNFGQLGYVDQTQLTTPGPFLNLGVPVVQIVAGYAHTCVLLNTGTVRCWGLNSNGQLGYGNRTNLSIPGIDINLGGIATQITAGAFHTCALLSTGNVRCWGKGGKGQLGYGNTNDIGDDESPSVAGDINIGGIVTQISAGNNHTCALLNTGAVHCWGDNGFGQLGYGYTVNIGDDELPITSGNINLGGIATQISAGGAHTCAVMSTGALRCWGYNSVGQLGYGNTNNIGDNEQAIMAGEVSLPLSVIQVATSNEHTCALYSNNGVACWGSNSSGQLGYGDTTNRLSPGANVASQFVKTHKRWSKNEK